MIRETFDYASSVDGVKPLVADVAMERNGRPKPLLVVMHGYNGSRHDVEADVAALAALRCPESSAGAARGVVAVAPDMRGRGESAGRWDSCGLDIHDILDAVLATIARYPGEIDATNLNIVGYSGGGACAAFCAVRFPDLFQTAVSFFGITDFAWWHASKGRPDCNVVLEKAVGGPPEAAPDAYAARSATAAAGNAVATRLHFFWDEEETQCPPGMTREFLARYRTAGLANVVVHESRKTDAHRWLHGYRTNHPAHLGPPADDLFMPDVLSPRKSSPRLPAHGRLVVIGYLVTRQFQVWNEDGQRGQVTVEYDLRGKEPAVKVVDNPKGFSVRIETTSPRRAAVAAGSAGGGTGGMGLMGRMGPMKQKTRCAVVAALVLSLASLAQAADTWTVTGMGGAGGMYTPTISPFDAKWMFISCDMSGAYRSVDGGKSWDLIHYKQLRSSRMTRPAFLSATTAFWADEGSLRVTTDKGATWTPVAGPWKDTVTHIVAAVGKAPQVVVGTASGVWAAPVAADGKAATWAALSSSPCKGLAAVQGDVFFAAKVGNASKVMHWMSAAGKAPYALAKSPGGDSANILALAASDPNKGERGETQPLVLAAIVENAGTFWSTDLGNTWNLSQRWEEQKDILMPAGGKVAWASKEGEHELWRTVDGGKSWQIAFKMNGAGANVELAWTQTFLRWDYSISHLGIGIDPNNPNVALLTSEGDFYRTNDGGKSWFQCQNDAVGVKRGDPGFRFKSIGLEVTSLWGYYFDPSDSARQYICYTDVGFARSVDRGATWISSVKGCPWSNTFYEIAFDPRVKGRIYAACSNRHDIPHWTHLDANKPQHAGGVCLSEDFGATWKPLSGGLPKLPCTSVAVDPKSPQGKLTLYAAFYEGGVYKSVDGGASWQKKSQGLGNPGNLHCVRLRFHPASNNLYCLVTAMRNGRDFRVPGGLWVSSDGGESWKDVTASAKFPRPTDFALDPKDEKTIYINASTIPGREIGGIYKTTDGGVTWTRLIGDADFAKWCGPSYYEGSTINIHPDDSNLLYAGGDGHGLWYSKDAGKTWKPYESFPFGSPQNVAFEPANHKAMIVTTFGAGAWKGPYLPGN